MDQAGPKAPKTARIAALVAACVLVAGLAAAGVLAVGDDRPGRAVITATGDQTGTVDVTSTVTIPIGPQPSTPPTTVHTTTTLAKAAVDVLNALGSTTTTRPRATTTTRPPAPTTTVPSPTPTTQAPTTTTIAQFSARIVNNHAQPIVLVVNNQTPISVAGAREGVPTETDVVLPVGARGDVVQARLAGDAQCGVYDSGVIFKAGGRYRVEVVVGQTTCNNSEFLSPLLRIAPL